MTSVCDAPALDDTSKAALSAACSFMKDVALTTLAQLVDFNPDITSIHQPNFAADSVEVRNRAFNLLARCEGARRFTETRRNDVRRALSEMESIWVTHKPIVDNIPDNSVYSAMGAGTRCISNTLLEYILDRDSD